MSKKLYRPKRKKSKEKLSFMDKLEMGSIVIAAAALIGWSGWSAMDALIPDPPVPTYSLYMDGITAFLMTTQGVEPDDQETDVETEGEDDTDATDTEETPEEPKVSETEEETDKNEAETEDESDKQDTGTENVKKKIKHVNKKDLVKTAVTPTTSPMLTQALEPTATPEPTVTPKPTVTQKPAVTPEPTATPKPKKKKKKSKPIYAGNESSKAGELSTPTEEPKTYTSATELNIREAPDKNSKALAMYMPGREITVTEDEQTHEGWLKVNKDGVEGYVSSEFVKTE